MLRSVDFLTLGTHDWDELTMVNVEVNTVRAFYPPTVKALLRLLNLDDPFHDITYSSEEASVKGAAWMPLWGKVLKDAHTESNPEALMNISGV